MRLILLAGFLGLLAWSGQPAAAEMSTRSGFHSGASAGRQVGGSVGTFVGGVTGAVVGAAGGLVHAVTSPLRTHHAHRRPHRR